MNNSCTFALKILRATRGDENVARYVLSVILGEFPHLTTEQRDTIIAAKEMMTAPFVIEP